MNYYFGKKLLVLKKKQYQASNREVLIDYNATYKRKKRKQQKG